MRNLIETHFKYLIDPLSFIVVVILIYVGLVSPWLTSCAPNKERYCFYATHIDLFHMILIKKYGKSKSE